MSLASAIQTLPDDRAMRAALRNVLQYLRAHCGEAVEGREVSDATGVPSSQVSAVLGALEAGFVVDCQPDIHACVYAPNVAVATEVDRFLFSSERSHDRFRGNVERFRGSYSRGR